MISSCNGRKVSWFQYVFSISWMVMFLMSEFGCSISDFDNLYKKFISKFVKMNIDMQTTQIREKLHQYIESSDEKLLKLMFALAKEYNDEDDFDYEFTSEDIKIFDERETNV